MRKGILGLLVPFLMGCSAGEKEEEGAEYKLMVLGEEEEKEWTSGKEDQTVAGEPVPEPQEVLL